MTRFMRSLFVTLFMVLPYTMSAYVVGDRLTRDGYHLSITDIDGNTVEARIIGSTLSGAIDIPEKIFDGVDTYFTITSLGQNDAVGWSSHITAVTIPSTVKTLAGYVFRNTQITTLHIPATVTNILSEAFQSALPLESITVDADNPNYESADGILYSKGKKALLYYPRAKPLDNGSFTIDNGVERIGLTAFFGMNNLTTLHIPASVKEIATGYPTITYSCVNLATITVAEENPYLCAVDNVIFDKAMSNLIFYPQGKRDTDYQVPDGVTTIGRAAFYNSRMVSIDLNDVQSLSLNSFYACNKLTHVKIPAGLTSLSSGFFSCANIEDYEVEEGNPVYSSNDGIVYSTDYKRLLLFPAAKSKDEHYTISESVGVTEISTNAFSGSSLSGVTIPTTVTAIMGSAFNTASIKTIDFAEPSQMQTIYSQAFSRCTKLESFTVPSSLTALGSMTFSYCTSLKEIIIPDGAKLKTIGNDLLNSSHSLERVVFQGSCPLQSIGNNAFYGQSNLSTFDFPATVTTIGQGAFKDCSGLKNVSFPADSQIKTISTAAFADCGLESFIIPQSVETIEKEAFRNCTALESITVSANTTFINPQAFKYCTNLGEFSVAADNPTYSSVQGMLCNKDKNTLLIFPPAKVRDDFTLLPPSLTSIGEYAFYDCQGLTNICIPSKVTSIGDRAFGLDDNLTSIAFLCDEPISPAAISQEENTMSFDNGTVAPTNMFENITIYVRKDLYDRYKNEEPYKSFYAQFKDIKTSFTLPHANDRSGNTEANEYFPMSNTAVSLLSTKAKVQTYVVPETVTNPADNVQYKVSLIGDYAFEGADSGLEEVVVKGDVGYIGAMAFLTKVKREGSSIKPDGSTIKEIVFTGNTPAEWLSTNYFDLTEDFNEFTANQKIYVKRSKLNDYQTKWASFAGQIASDIPMKAMNYEYGSFSREFDVDLNPDNRYWDSDRDCPQVIAFTAGAPYTAEVDGETIRYVRMRSINIGQDKSIDGTYIPANTGVLLRAVAGSAAARNYCIGEEDNMSTPTDNLMQSVTVNDAQISPNTGEDTNLFVSQGKLWTFTDPMTMPIHLSYMSVSIPEGAKLQMLFDSEEETPQTNEPSTEPESATTSIQGVGDNTVIGSSAAWYTLQGQRISHPQKGIYIVNGKKVAVR